MFSGAHVILYSRDAEADRAFLRDVVGFEHVDAGGAGSIFKLPPAEIAVHPTTDEPKHEVYLMCDNLTETLTTLDKRGVAISRAITDERWGLLAAVRLPSGTELALYDRVTPRHTASHPDGLPR
ncbi:extradiol dioxygenase [Streptomyces tanashiensis]